MVMVLASGLEDDVLAPRSILTIMSVSTIITAIILYVSTFVQ